MEAIVMFSGIIGSFVALAAAAVSRGKDSRPQEPDAHVR
jgi:hypothetical protein